MRPIVTDSEITEQRPHPAAPGHAALTDLLESGTNGAATIIGNSRQNLGNLGCWGVGVEWWGWGRGCFVVTELFWGECGDRG
jgi:hypothetical protein